MKDLERELREALRREEPSADFRARVVAAAEKQTNRSWGFNWLSLRWAGAAAALLAIVLGIPMYREAEAKRRAEGEEARKQVMLALRIAGMKVRLAQTKVQNLSGRENGRQQ